MSASNFLVTKVGNELTDAITLREALAGEDEQMIADMIEGATELHEVICVIAEEIAERELMLPGIKAAKEELTSRASRTEAAIDKMRSLIVSTMERAGIKKITAPTMTISLKALAPKVIVTDEAEILAHHPELFTQPAPKLDRTALKEAMNQGDVAGADWSNGGATIAIKRS